jgi:hypothetical protein
MERVLNHEERLGTEGNGSFANNGYFQSIGAS